MAVVQLSKGTIRPMVEEELSLVATVDAKAYPYPWSEQIFRDCLNVGYNCLVYEDDQGMLGYGIMSMAVGEAHILNLCVMPEKQGRGYGREILLYMLDLAKARNIETVFLEVRLSNEPAKRLYDRVGFNEVGIRKNYYPADKGREDALIFALNLYYD